MVSPPIPPSLLNDDGTGNMMQSKKEENRVEKKKKEKMSNIRTDQTIPDCPPYVLFSLCNRASFLPSHHVEPPVVPVVDSRLLHLSHWVLLSEARKPLMTAVRVTNIAAQTGCFVHWARTPKDFWRCSTLSFHPIPFQFPCCPW